MGSMRGVHWGIEGVCSMENSIGIVSTWHVRKHPLPTDITDQIDRSRAIKKSVTGTAVVKSSLVSYLFFVKSWISRTCVKWYLHVITCLTSKFVLVSVRFDVRRGHVLYIYDHPGSCSPPHYTIIFSTHFFFFFIPQLLFLFTV